MTKDQHTLLIKTITDVFGECKTNADADTQSILITVGDAQVVVCSTGVEVDSINGPMMVAGWEVGIVNEDEEFEEECLTENFWEMASTVAEMLAEQRVFDIRSKLGIEHMVEEQQYE